MGRLGVCLLVAAAVARGAGVEGTWSGAMAAGDIKLRLILHVTREANGALRGSLDSIDQRVYGIPGRLSLRGALLRAEFPKIRASFRGRLDALGGECAGSYRQARVTLPLTLKKGVARPQEPRPPFPYDEAPVVIEDRGGTLTLPRGNGPHPAALLLTGSGPQDRDNAMAGHRPFLVMADYLARRGIAVLRVDDRNWDQPARKFYDFTTEDFAADARQAVEFLRRRPEIDARRIGLIGHSEGGLVAALVAARDPAIAFVVLLAAPGVPGDQIMVEQNYRIAKAMGVPDETAMAVRDMNRTMCHLLEAGQPEGRVRAELKQKVQASTALEPLAADLERQLAFTHSRWFRFLLTYDPDPTLEKVRAPVLVMSGSRDLVVSPEQNLPAIEGALRAGQNRDYTILRMPGLNHLFQTCRTGSPAEYADIGETFAPEALSEMGEWIGARVER